MHCRIEVQLFRIEIVSNPICGFFDRENYSSDHIHGPCEALMHSRTKHLGACQLELFSLTVSIRMLVVYYGNRVEEDLIGGNPM